MPIKKESNNELTDGSSNDYGNLIIDFNIIYPESLSDKQKLYLNKIFNAPEKKENKHALQAYYYKDKEEVIKEIMNDDEEESSGCIQQ